MTIGEQPEQKAIDQIFLTDDNVSDLLANGRNPLAKFSYLLPARLRHGKYVLDVKVLDRAYNAGRASVPFGVK